MSEIKTETKKLPVYDSVTEELLKEEVTIPACLYEELKDKKMYRDSKNNGEVFWKE